MRNRTALLTGDSGRSISIGPGSVCDCARLVKDPILGFVADPLSGRNSKCNENVGIVVVLDELSKPDRTTNSCTTFALDSSGRIVRFRVFAR